MISNLLTNYQIYPCDESKETLLILHGWQCNITSWTQVAVELSKQINVMLLDLPGFGQTQEPSTAWEITDYADFVEEFIKKLELTNLTIMGHSFGGRIALILAPKNLCDKLILVDSAGLPIKDLKAKILLMATKVGKPILKLLPRKYSKIFLDLIVSADYKNSGTMLKTFKKIVLPDLSNYTKKITVPTLIIWGDRDEMLSLKHAKRFKKLIPNSTLRIIWGAGHNPHLEKPEKFVELIREELRVTPF
ncbi:MAG: alpha/beta hydrolase [Patescibacteria group bacterium]